MESVQPDTIEPSNGMFPLFPEVDSKNSTVCLWQSKEEAEQLLNALRPFIPENWWEGTRLSGLHDVLQFERLAYNTANIFFVQLQVRLTGHIYGQFYNCKLFFSFEISRPGKLLLLVFRNN